MDSVIFPVGDIHVATGISRDSPGEIELPFTTAKSSPCGDKFAILSEFLDAVITAVHHIDVVIGIRGETRRTLQFTNISTWGPPSSQKSSIFITFCDTVYLSKRCGLPRLYLLSTTWRIFGHSQTYFFGQWIRFP